MATSNYSSFVTTPTPRLPLKNLEHYIRARNADDVSVGAPRQYAAVDVPAMIPVTTPPAGVKRYMVCDDSSSDDDATRVPKTVSKRHKRSATNAGDTVSDAETVTDVDSGDEGGSAARGGGNMKAWGTPDETGDGVTKADVADETAKKMAKKLARKSSRKATATTSTVVASRKPARDSDGRPIVNVTHRSGGDAGYLSNFTRIPGGVVASFAAFPVTDAGKVAHETCECLTVEAAFQSAKARFVARGTSAAVAAYMEALKLAETGAAAKTIGARKSFSARGLVLDIAAWNKHKAAIMAHLLQLRAAVDRTFADILRANARAGVRFTHNVGRGAKDTTDFAGALNCLAQRLLAREGTDDAQ